MKAKKAIIICIGDELLIGQTIDTNSAWIAQAIAGIGFETIRKYVISDKEDEIIEALSFAINDAQLVIITGGLGPTKDDITKTTLSKFFDAPLIRNEVVLTHVRQFFAKRNRPMLATNEAQADVPNNCTVLFNRVGTAPGMLFEKNETTIVSLPGVPYETQVIVDEELIPRLSEWDNKKGQNIHRHLMTFGIGESFLAEKIKDIEEAIPENIKLAYLPEHNLMRLRLSGKDAPSTVLSQQLDLFSKLIKERVSKYIIAEKDSTLEAIVVEKYQQNRLSLSTAESCTGGQIASTITDVPGASKVFMGGIVSYDNRIKTQELQVDSDTLANQGAVSHETVQIMARNCRAKFGTDVAISVSGILGPTGGTELKPVGLVYIGIDSKFGTESFEFKYHYDRIINKEMVVRQALNLLRLEAIKFEV